MKSRTHTNLMRLIKVYSRWCAIAGLLRWGIFAANANVGEGLWPNDVRRTSSSRNKTSLNKCHLKTHQWPKRQHEKSLAARYMQRRCLRKRKRPCATRSTVAQQREWIRQRACRQIAPVNGDMQLYQQNQNENSLAPLSPLGESDAYLLAPLSPSGESNAHSLAPLSPY